MNKIKYAFLLLTALFFSHIIKAQTIEDGRKFLYYERYKSAKEVFGKLLAANPNNTDAAYWLGQAAIGQEDVAGAKDIYQKTLMANSNSALLIAGMGHIALLEGNSADARNRFETAISLSQGKNIAVLNAIGFANINAKTGDAAYAVEKLKQAVALKGMKDPDVYCNLGDAYRKNGDGGNAQLSYEAALALNPNYARASYRIGKIYQTQGITQSDIYMKYFNEAIAKDPAYAPVYYNLHDYYYTTDVVKSAEYLDKFLANVDDDPKNCYYRASMKFAQGLFPEAVTESDKCIAASSEPYPKLYALKGYAYNRMGDSVNAKATFDYYFQKQKPDNTVANDYVTYGTILRKFPGNDSVAAIYIDKGVALDTVEVNKVTYLKAAAVYYESAKKYKEAADWYKKVLAVKANPGKVDLYNAGYNYNRGGDYQQSIDIFNTYIQKYPSESFGYYMNGKNYVKLDSTDASGSGLSNFKKVVDMTDSIKDKPGEKDRIKNSLQYLIEYYANIKKDKEAALLYTDKGIILDSLDLNFPAIKEQILKANFNAPKTAPKTPAAQKQPAAKAAEKPKPQVAPKEK